VCRKLIACVHLATGQDILLVYISTNLNHNLSLFFIDAYSVKHIAYQWRDDSPSGSVTIAKDVQLPQFIVMGYRVRDKLEVQSTGWNCLI